MPRLRMSFIAASATSSESSSSRATLNFFGIVGAVTATGRHWLDVSVGVGLTRGASYWDLTVGTSPVRCRCAKRELSRSELAGWGVSAVLNLKCSDACDVGSETVPTSPSRGAGGWGEGLTLPVRDLLVLRYLMPSRPQTSSTSAPTSCRNEINGSSSSVLTFERQVALCPLPFKEA